MFARTLYGLRTSPWTSKAAFALDAAGLPYQYVEHTPMLGERALRRRAKQKPASVPLLIDGEQPIMGSWAIAEHASRHGRRQLIREHERAQVLAWHERSERALSAARVLLLERLLQSPAALEESLPAFVPRPLRGLLRFAARDGVRYVQKKYAVKPSPEARQILTAELEALRASLRGDTVLAEFSFADIAMAAVVNAIAPSMLEPLTAQTGPATRACWTQPELGEGFADLLAWRDRLYAQHRQAPA